MGDILEGKNWKMRTHQVMCLKKWRCYELKKAKNGASSEQEELARSLCKLMWPNPSAANQSAADFLLDQTESGGK